MQDEIVNRYHTRGGLQVIRKQLPLDYATATDGLVQELDDYQGVLLSSSFEFPGRYQRWDVGFVRPPLRLSSQGREMQVTALNARGELLLPVIARALQDCTAVQGLQADVYELLISIKTPEPFLYEEERSRQHSVFSVLRALMDYFAYADDPHFGLYGAFGYELAFQFEAVEQRLQRSPDQRDLALFLPDELIVVDHQKETAFRLYYDFFVGEKSTLPLPRTGKREAYGPPVVGPAQDCDHSAGEYAATVRKAKEYFSRGDLFETVPGQTFYAPCHDNPSAVFRRLRSANPAPYGAFMNLGNEEYLVAASPEMFVRVKQGRVETCPISGTIARGKDALEDARQVRQLLNSEKDLAELSMCTDVDRNDKARVCVPGSVKVIGRRQIEMYSRLIHTVDHVEGKLREGRDALDAFLSHAWAVTVTGAPKQAAIQFIEDHEKSPRRWYGGAMGFIGFNGNMNTGLTLRTIRIEEGIAEVRAGATLLYDSDPVAEEQETRLKASALLAAICDDMVAGSIIKPTTSAGDVVRRRVLMVDHQDSFVHNLVAYLQTHDAEVLTVRPEGLQQALMGQDPDLVVLSPGPGRPIDFGLSDTIATVLERNIPIFGVCLGLQGIVEHFGGSLKLLKLPMHGKASEVRASADSQLFRGMGKRFPVGRYHSLVAEKVPDCLRVTARSDDGSVMAVEHRHLSVTAVQFHPESILSMEEDRGVKLIANVLNNLMKAETLPLASGDM